MSSTPAIIPDTLSTHKGTAPPAPAVTVRDLIDSWLPGQGLRAVAKSDSDAAGRLLLKIGPSLLAATSPVPIKSGQRLALEVMDLGPRPLLRLLAPPASSPHTAIAPYLRRTLPRQSDPAPLLNRLLKLAASPASPLPALTASMERLLAATPRASELRTPAGLKDALLNSGIFLESSLRTSAGTPSAPNRDFKAGLLRLDREIKQRLAGYGTAAAPRGKDQVPPPRRGAGESPRPSQDPAQTRPLQELLAGFRQGRLSLNRLAGLLLRQLAPPQVLQLQEVLGRYLSKRQLPPGTPEPLRLIVEALRQKTSPSRQTAALLQMLREFPLLQELQSHTEGALAQLQGKQLLSVNREGNGLFLLLDLPVRHDDEVNTLRLAVEEQPRAGVDGESTWQVTLHFHLPALGPLRVEAQLAGQRLSSRFQAAHEDTARQIRENMPQLVAALSALGLTVATPEVGVQATEPQSLPPGPAAGLLDETA